ncbi:heavy metal translocating P-type ATPase [Nibricoccus sp. IMCC34717]|uniref:heavy metal translocating P-type ATPase n=1 Tax=Nibricoccus sp. IMCC34717 TaxID=3034021 RepID=UPI00384ABB24
MPTSKAGANDWAEQLARFLKEAPGIEAVRIDREARKVSVATIGEVNLKELEARLAETLKAVEESLAQATHVPIGFQLKREGSTTELAEITCATAPRFWKWREFSWPEEPQEAHEPEWKELATFAAVCGAFGIAGFVSDKLGLGPAWLSRAFYGVALIAGGWDAAKDTWENLRERKLDIHFLMLAVAVGAVAIGAWGEAVLLLFLFSASGAMEDFALDRTQREVGSLLKTAPKSAARVRSDGVEETVMIDAIRVQDTLRVRPGDAFPADGLVIKGETACDESALTGEAEHVEKAVGAPVFSGTLNLWGVVEIRVQRLPSESTLQKIIRLIQTAQKLKAPSQRFTDRFGGGYTLLVLGVCAVMFFVWWLAFGIAPFSSSETSNSAFYRAMTLLVVMSPCALVLSIPSAILAAIAWGAKHGVLFRGGAAIERLAEVNTIALDKTGTLTTGELAVLGVESFPAGNELRLLELAFALEKNSQHPLARAVVRHARAQGVKELEVKDFESLTGQGLKGEVDGEPVLLGRRELLEQGPLADWAKALPPASAEFTEVWVVGRSLVGRLLLRDAIREKSRGVLDALRELGIQTVMLTGDRRHAAESVAKHLGLSEVRAGLSPEGKVAAIREFREQGRVVAMVGDGVNDAPSLAAADVSMAMGARGSDAALEQAEVILMHDRIENVLSALELSRKARVIIRQNLAISLGVVVLMAIASIFGIVPLAVGVAAHEGSTVIVCLNSLRLLIRGPLRG